MLIPFVLQILSPDEIEKYVAEIEKEKEENEKKKQKKTTTWWMKFYWVDWVFKSLMSSADMKAFHSPVLCAPFQEAYNKLPGFLKTLLL